MTSSSQKATQLLADLTIAEEDTDRLRELSPTYVNMSENALTTISKWNEHEQLDFMEKMVQMLSHYQLGKLDSFIRPMLQRDFISNLPENIPEIILLNLDASTLTSCESVSVAWKHRLAVGQLWKKLIERNVRNDGLWKGLSVKRNWNRFINIGREIAVQRICEKYGHSYAEIQKSFKAVLLQHVFYRKLYPRVLRDIDNLESNWRKGNFKLDRITCRSENIKGVYCLQYDDDKIVSGLRDNTIKIWDRKDNSCRQVLSGHTGSVLCLQYDNRVIISGSSDSTVRVWDVETGECLKTLIHHCEAVLHLRFANGIMVTCSKDRSIAVWDMVSPREINIRRVLVGHRAAVNVVDFDDKYIVSASGDRTIKVWSMDSLEFVRTLAGHRRGIACLQHRGRLVVSGSSDYTIRLWDIHSGVCLRVLEGHEELVRCIRFDEKRIVSGAYDGKIKVWDLQAALDPRSLPGSICLCSLVEHTGRVFRLQFDDFQIVSSSHDDTILIWDFLNAETPVVAGSSTSTSAAAAANDLQQQVAASAAAAQAIQQQQQQQQQQANDEQQRIAQAVQLLGVEDNQMDIEQLPGAAQLAAFLERDRREINRRGDDDNSSSDEALAPPPRLVPAPPGAERRRRGRDPAGFNNNIVEARNNARSRSSSREAL